MMIEKGVGMIFNSGQDRGGLHKTEIDNVKGAKNSQCASPRKSSSITIQTGDGVRKNSPSHLRRAPGKLQRLSAAMLDPLGNALWGAWGQSIAKLS